MILAQPIYRICVLLYHGWEDFGEIGRDFTGVDNLTHPHPPIILEKLSLSLGWKFHY